jgi:hypothetical protein
MPRIIIVAGLFLLSFCSFAQISTPEKRKFNVGVYAGLSIWKYRPMLAVDLSYKGTTLRLMPNYNYYSGGITQELVKISPVFYNLYWTASVYGGYGFEYDVLPSISLENVKKNVYTGVFSTGLKTYFAKRLYTHIMGGVMYNQYQEAGVKNSSEVLPYFEFGLGFQFFKTYPVLKREETAE